jgi:hypothetical protein
VAPLLVGLPGGEEVLLDGRDGGKGDAGEAQPPTAAA